MDKRWMVLFFVVFFVSGVQAISSTLETTYEARETIIGQFSEDVITIDQSNLNVLRDGHVEVGFNGDIQKINDIHYIWLPAPNNQGSYTLVAEDVIASVDGFPEVVTFSHDFVVVNETDYAISPGVLVHSSDFSMSATLYEDFSTTINVDYPVAREVTLVPGINTINFEFDEFVGNRFELLQIGKYRVPALLIGQEYICGDGAVDGSEVCDGSNLNGRNCITEGFDQGDLLCSSSCLSLNTAQCENVEEIECSSENVEVCLDQNECDDSGGFWYNATCNQYEEGSSCDEDHLGLCESFTACFSAGGFWYEESCHDEAEPVCDADNLELCTTFGACFDAEGFWYDGECHEVAEEDDRPVRFEIAPRRIQSTAFIGAGPPRYDFRIVNTGGRVIDELFFDYKTNDFIVEPSSILNFEPNSSATVSLRFRDTSTRPVRGAVLAYAENVSDHLLFEVEFTNNEEEVVTEFSGGSGYYCSELGGRGCASNEVCEGALQNSIDESACCLGTCQSANGSGGSVWIGYLLAGILILILLIIYVRYKKTGKSKSPTARRFREAERRLP